MSNFDSIKHDIAFWTGFYGGDPIEWASDKAYLDMNRTLTFVKNTEKDHKIWKDKVTKIIEDKLRNDNANQDFITWHEETCIAMIDGYEGELQNEAKLTFGQAQKWLNMTLKYLWLLYRLDALEDDGISVFIKKYQNSFHVPIDSYIKRYVEKQPKSKKIPENNGLIKEIPENLKWGDTSWSHIDGDADKIKYYAYQTAIAESINTTPLEWELEHWHKALEFYESKQKA